MEDKESISQDDLESLRFMAIEVEKAQSALQSYQQHIAQKYLKPGDAIKPDGEIVRAGKPQRPIAVPDESKSATG